MADLTYEKLEKLSKRLGKKAGGWIDQQLAEREGESLPLRGAKQVGRWIKPPGDLPNLPPEELAKQYAQSFATGGMTKMEALKSFLKPQSFGAKPPGDIKSIYNTVKIILTHPEKYLQHLKEFRYEPGLHKETLGRFDPKEMSIILHPWDHPPYSRRYFSKPSSGSTIWETVSHELGHLDQAVEHPSVFKAGYRGALFYPLEGSAEWLGKAQARRAGVPFRPGPMFVESHNLRNIWGQLSRSNAGDPYQTVADYLRGVLINLEKEVPK